MVALGLTCLVLLPGRFYFCVWTSGVVLPQRPRRPCESVYWWPTCRWCKVEIWGFAAQDCCSIDVRWKRVKTLPAKHYTERRLGVDPPRCKIRTQTAGGLFGELAQERNSTGVVTIFSLVCSRSTVHVQGWKPRLCATDLRTWVPWWPWHCTVT